MFVDDDPMILASIQRQLARKLTAYDFVFCDGGHKALAEADTRRPHVLFTDMRMPGMDGLKLLTEFVNRHPTTICFALSGQFSAMERLQVESLVKLVLCKPVDFTMIVEIIQSVLPPSDLN